ncbi:hypothetical protein [Haloarcula sp. 1CSR25-25]|uniref:hypothetical protein n=1 Tax=Haloarcula sp. 1CSR25-25 TaxID=2862545 RepID=UPI002893BA6E|nr:hypothetical protein [Haloarcula sp. 1CSR25-25]MDT3437342.1 hypothetical protein [Haloarcula sp. 1CSR25-25]
MTADDSGASSMLARTWEIAANYKRPEDFDIPHAPRFLSETTGEGATRLVSRDGTVILEASVTSSVRR